MLTSYCQRNVKYKLLTPISRPRHKNLYDSGVQKYDLSLEMHEIKIIFNFDLYNFMLYATRVYPTNTYDMCGMSSFPMHNTLQTNPGLTAGPMFVFAALTTTQCQTRRRSGQWHRRSSPRCQPLCTSPTQQRQRCATPKRRCMRWMRSYSQVQL